MYPKIEIGCDLLKIHYLCGNKDNFSYFFIYSKGL